MIFIDIFLYSGLFFIGLHLIKIMMTLLIQWCSEHKDIKYCKFINLQYLKTCAWIKSGEVIAMIDYRGKITYSVAVPMPLEDFKLSYANWQLQVGPLWLYEDGTVTRPHNDFSHINYWLPIDVEKRTFMILQGARGFEF